MRAVVLLPRRARNPPLPVHILLIQLLHRSLVATLATPLQEQPACVTATALLTGTLTPSTAPCARHVTNEDRRRWRRCVRCVRTGRLIVELRLEAEREGEAGGFGALLIEGEADVFWWLGEHCWGWLYPRLYNRLFMYHRLCICEPNQITQWFHFSQVCNDDSSVGQRHTLPELPVRWHLGSALWALRKLRTVPNAEGVATG